MPPQSVQDRQVLEIPPVQLPQEGDTTLARIPSQAQRKQAETPAPQRKALLTLTLTNRQGEYITGVGKEDVRLSIDGKYCEILSLTSDHHTPVSIGILLDTSGSMNDKLAEAEDGLRHFVNSIYPEDEVFLLAFNDTPWLVQDFTNDRETLGRAKAQRKQAETPAPQRKALLTLTLTNRQGEYITGVGKEDVRLSIDGKYCEILSLTSDHHTPVSIGILLDTSGSMNDKLAEAEDGLEVYKTGAGSPSSPSSPLCLPNPFRTDRSWRYRLSSCHRRATQR